MAFQPSHSPHMPLTFQHPPKHEYPHWPKGKARDFAEDSDWQVGFSLLQLLPGWVRFAPTAFINVSMNTIFMHWISKANSQLIMQNNPEVFQPPRKPGTDLSLSIWTVMNLTFHL